MPLRTVLCWDGSNAADTAADWALRRATAARTTVEVFDVVDLALFLGDEGALERATTAEEGRLAKRVEELAEAHPGTVAGSALLVGDPFELLEEQTQPGTLLVVGTSHRVGPRVRYGWSLGARLATAAAGPVAIVPEEEAADARSRSGVVVGVDGSVIGRLALELAAAEADALRQPLTIVHCWQEPLADEPLVVADEDFVSSQELAHRELLEDHVRSVAEAHPEVSVEGRLLRGNPVTALRVAAERALMLVVGSRRLTGWRRAWLGSVSHGLVLDLAAPTVVVGPETVVGVTD